MDGLDAGYCPCPPRSNNDPVPHNPEGCDPFLVGGPSGAPGAPGGYAKRRLARKRLAKRLHRKAHKN